MNATVNHILKYKSITDYLERKGVRPYSHISGGRVAYLCPFPDHEETKPSFMVWTNAEFENFYCFGCSRGWNIIHLVAGLENISYAEAIRRLGDGMEVSVDENINLELEMLGRQFARSHQIEVAEVLESIASLSRSYLESVSYDPMERGIIDRFFAVVDNYLNQFNFDGLSEMLRYLPWILALRRERFEEIKLEEMRQKARNN